RGRRIDRGLCSELHSVRFFTGKDAAQHGVCHHAPCPCCPGWIPLWSYFRLLYRGILRTPRFPTELCGGTPHDRVGPVPGTVVAGPAGGGRGRRRKTGSVCLMIAGNPDQPLASSLSIRYLDLSNPGRTPPAVSGPFPAVSSCRVRGDIFQAGA